MSIVDDIVEAAWSHTPRTLGAEGDGVPRSAWLQALQAAVWSYETRTLSSGPTTLRAAVRTLLADLPDLVDVVGDRISYAGSAQSDPEPRVTFIVASRTAGRDLAGPDGTSLARVRVSVWSDDSIEAEAMADAIREGLDGFTGWVGQVYVVSCDYEVEIDLPEQSSDTGGDALVYQIVIDFSVDHRL